MRFVISLFLCLLAPMALAQQEDSVFDNYADYDAFVTKHVMTRDFVPFVQRLGGRDEYTKEQLAQTNAGLLNAFPKDFTGTSVFKRVEMADGFSQEARAFWTEKGGYAFYYAFLHDRGDKIIVLRFNMNSSSAKVLNQF